MWLCLGWVGAFRGWWLCFSVGWVSAFWVVGVGVFTFCFGVVCVSDCGYFVNLQRLTMYGGFVGRLGLVCCDKDM